MHSRCPSELAGQNLRVVKRLRHVIMLPIKVKICSKEQSDQIHGTKTHQVIERLQSPLVRGTSIQSSFSRSKSPISLSSVRQHPRPKQKFGRPTNLPLLLIVPVLLYTYDEPQAERVEEVEDKYAGGQGWVLERPDRAGLVSLFGRSNWPI